MPVINAGGIISGMDTKAVVEALVGAEVAPALSRIKRSHEASTAELSSLGQVKAALAKFQASMIKLSNPGIFQSFKGTLSDSSLASVNVTGATNPGSYTLEVNKLAARHTLASGTFTDETTNVGNGTLTINFGTYSSGQTVFTANPDKSPLVLNISPSNSSLSSIKDTINNAKAGVTASIIKDSNGARLTLSSTETGENLAMQISVSDNDGSNTNGSGLSQLAYNPTAGVNSMTQTIAAQNSEIKLNGLILTHTSNEIKDAIAGITLNLNKTNPGVSNTLTIDKNNEQMQNLVNEFVKQYNEAIAAMKSGGLQSDATIRSLRQTMASLLSTPIIDGKALSYIGLKTSKAGDGGKVIVDGTLSLDTERFNKVMSENPEMIAKLFSRSATASDPNVSVSAVGGNMKAGTYRVQLDSYDALDKTLTGTIGGVFANGKDGRILLGSGEFKGMELTLSDFTLGDRGTITITDGVAKLMDNLISGYLNEKGIITTRSNDLNTKLKALTKEQEDLGPRVEKLTKRYATQFAKMEQMLAAMQQTSSYLEQQLANISNMTKRK